MYYLRHLYFLLIIVLTSITVHAQQPQFSLNIDAGILRSFKKGQQFWAPGQTTWANFHLSPKNGAYAFFNYYINGRFTNSLVATAKDPATTPQEIGYTNKVKFQFSHISIGWKRYLAGNYLRDYKWNAYAYAGLGLMMGRIENANNRAIDTTKYIEPVLSGNGKFKRLTIDPGIGFERSIGGDIYFYVEARSLIPVTSYPSPYLLVNKYAPLNASLHIGLRIFFE